MRLIMSSVRKGRRAPRQQGDASLVNHHRNNRKHGPNPHSRSEHHRHDAVHHGLGKKGWSNCGSARPLRIPQWPWPPRRREGSWSQRHPQSPPRPAPQGSWHGTTPPGFPACAQYPSTPPGQPPPPWRKSSSWYPLSQVRPPATASSPVSAPEAPTKITQSPTALVIMSWSRPGSPPFRSSPTVLPNRMAGRIDHCPKSCHCLLSPVK